MFSFYLRDIFFVIAASHMDLLAVENEVEIILTFRLSRGEVLARLKYLVDEVEFFFEDRV